MVETLTEEAQNYMYYTKIFKPSILNIFKELKESTSKEIKEQMESMSIK